MAHFYYNFSFPMSERVLLETLTVTVTPTGSTSAMPLGKTTRSSALRAR